MDFASVIKRPDTDFFARDPLAAPGNGYDANNSLLFLSTIMSSEGDRNLSMIAYRIDHNNDNGGYTCLLRAGKPVTWAKSAKFMGLNTNGVPIRFSTSDTDFDNTLLSADLDFDVLAPGVLQMTIGYQLCNDNQPVTLVSGATASGNAQGDLVYSLPIRTLTASDGTTKAIYADLSRVASIVVGIVAIDTENLKLLSANSTTTLSQAFATPPNGKLPVQAWASVANGLTYIPLPARQAIRVYECFYPLNH
jgi:hypothetical protein